MEAMRILKAIRHPAASHGAHRALGRRGAGLFRLAQYVKEHFADPATMQLKPEHAKFSAYFNVDNGTGTIRGVYQQGNEAVAPIFHAWMEPFTNLGMTTLTIRNTGGTDHPSFDNVGLPGFQFIQDPIEYDTRTHHSNQDYYERIQPQDMMNNAVIVASFVANAANRDERLPRKPLPKGEPRRAMRFQRASDDDDHRRWSGVVDRVHRSVRRWPLARRATIRLRRWSAASTSNATRPRSRG